MGPRKNLKRSVLQAHVVKYDADGEDVVIGVRIEGEILMPFHFGAIAGLLHVQLGRMHADIRADQVAGGSENETAAHQRVEERALQIGPLDAAYARRLWRMSVFQVDQVIASRDTGGMS